jgi:hypothetical protein
MHHITGTRRKPAGAAKTAIVLALLLLPCLGLAACGSSGSSTTNATNADAAARTTGGRGAGATGSTGFRSTRKIRRFGACMRANGVKLPEPNFSGSGPVFKTKGFEMNSEQFRAAADKCRGYLRQSLGGARSGTGGATG